MSDMMMYKHRIYIQSLGIKQDTNFLFTMFDFISLRLNKHLNDFLSINFDKKIDKDDNVQK